MTPRLLFVCLGGLAGAGALVSCDLDEGLEPLDAQPEGEAAGEGAAGDELAEADAEASIVH